ncbi:hypothetical protein [Paraburkholderia sp. RL17-337-BIB-A]|uniref:hypothetical protein n=1 Tax=Paraburkholderia sp. RL17-337-BIB-A TaxID=3031636 RepID=UPI0038B97D07
MSGPIDSIANAWQAIWVEFFCLELSVWILRFAPIKANIILRNEMKRLAALVMFAGIGAITGTVAACIVLAFAPMCGYDCESYATGIWFFITVACLVAFPYSAMCSHAERDCVPDEGSLSLLDW